MTTSANGEIYEAAINLEKVVKRVLKKEIFSRVPELRTMVEKFRRFWIDIEFTKDTEKVFTWVIEGSKLIPDRLLQQFIDDNSAKLKLATTPLSEDLTTD